MLFNSYAFLLVYLPIVWSGFFALAHFHLARAARLWLLLSSCAFYAYWDSRFLPLLLGSIAFNYLVGQAILGSQHYKKGWLWLGVSGDLTLLFYFKYFDFFAQLWDPAHPISGLILPLGISFFTFTQIAYLVDAYYGKTEPCSWVSYGLFVTVFPHLIAGPILHHRDMIGQFHRLRLYVLSWSNISQGIFLFVLGLSKKVLIADHLAKLAAPVFDQTMPHIPFIQAWLGALAYTLQLYFDFSGYSDMAIGLGLLFNLHLPTNFNSPYRATSIIDFWRRWHMTLSLFLRDYLYISLGGNRGGRWLKWRNLFITMLIGGLWHGAGWTFVLWGACHGIFLIVNHLWRDTGYKLPLGFARLLTWMAIIFSWVLFRSSDLTTAIAIWKGMIGWNGLVLPIGYATYLHFLQPWGVVFAHMTNSHFRLLDITCILTVGVVALTFPNSQEWQQRFKRRPLIWAFPCAALFLMSFLQLDDLAEFLYYQF